MSINEFLNKKFSLLDSAKNKTFLVVFITVFLILYLNIYTPFNMETWVETEKGNSLLIMSIFSVIVGFITAFSQFVLRKVFKVTEFTVKTYLMWLFMELFMIGFLLTLLFSDFNDVTTFILELGFSLKLTYALAIIPNVFFILMLSLIKYKSEITYTKTELDKLKENKNKVVIANELINIPDDKGNVKFSLPLDEILYLESTDNYVFIYYFANSTGTVKKELLRNSLKKLEAIFDNYPIKRCHRSFMVNLNNLDLVKKSGQKMTITISHITETIPVSKTYQKEFNKYLNISK